MVVVIDLSCRRRPGPKPTVMTPREINRRRRRQERRDAMKSTEHLADVMLRIRDGSSKAEEALLRILKQNKSSKFQVLTNFIQRAERNRITTEAVASTLQAFGSQSAPSGKTGRSAYRMNFVSLLMSRHQSTSSKLLHETLNLNRDYVRKAVSESKKALRNLKRKNSKLERERYTSDQRHGVMTTHELVQGAIEEFIMEHTHHWSGDRSKPRKLLLTNHELDWIWQGDYPERLRKMAQRNPSVLHRKKGQTVWTKLQADIITAQWSARQEDFDEVQEYQNRFDFAREQYFKKLAHDRLRRKKITTPAPPKVVQKRDLTINTFRPEVYSIVAPRDKTFWKVVKYKDIRISRSIKNKPCRLHDNGPVWLKQLPVVVEQLRALQSTNTPSPSSIQMRLELLTMKRTLERDIQNYKLHLEQDSVQAHQISLNTAMIL